MKKLMIMAAALLLTSGCATKGFNANSVQNPAPTKKFSSFKYFDLQPIAINPEFAADGANQKAAAKIQQHLETKLSSYMRAWNQASQPKLVIRPRIEKIKFVGGAARFWAGAMAGSSAVYMRVSYEDAATGEIIADPEFLQIANAMGGAWSFGGSDNAMLERIASLIADYTASNYARAIGGPTGATAKLVK